MERTCTKCGETKPIEGFHKNAYSCKDCHAIYSKIYRELNKDKNKKRKLKYAELEKNKSKIEFSVKSYKDKIKKEKRILKNSLKDNDRQYIKLYKETKNDLFKENEYISNSIYHITGLSYKKIKQYPELIENWRQYINIKRLLKSKKNENIKTS